MQGNNYGNNKGIGERIKEAIPGTEEHRATHGVTPGHANVEGMKSHLPGTEEHRMREAGVIGGGSAMTGTHGTGTQAHGTMGERIKEAIPGTREHEATHGMTGAHRGAEQMKAHIPGTEEHHMRTGVEAGHGMGVMGTGVGTGYGHNTGMGTGTAYDTHHTGMGTGVGGVGTHHTGMTGAGVGTGGIDPETGKETMGHKIKKMIPGTEENKEKKLAQGRI